MKLKIMLPLLALILLLSFPSLGMARKVHDFACANCHKAGASLATVGNIVCLDCHTAGMVGTEFVLMRGGGFTNGISDSTFATGDSSDALGSLTTAGGTPGDETSHNWASADDNPAAGATAPSNRRFYGRSNYSGRNVTCARCHNPHGYDTDPKLLKLGAGSEVTMCNDCHVTWATVPARSEGGDPLNVHPMVVDYLTIAADNVLKYNNLAALNATLGEVTLNGTFGVDCLSCHGVHFTDSDSSTTDGAGQVLNVSDGKILKGNGASFDQADVDGVSLCQACHKYQDHGTGRTNQIGCLVCHGAHLEASGTMNNYMLRSSITTYLPKDSASGTVSGLVLKIADDPKQRLWDYCFKCHDSAAAVSGHVPSWDCSACHSHSDTNGSWTASGGCNTCHGYPPSANSEYADPATPNGFAAGYDSKTYAKDESTTLHRLHAGDIEYTFSCSSCHAGNNHIDGNYDDVFISTSNTIFNGDGRLIDANAPTYVSGAPSDAAERGTCASVYCHSNGGPLGAVPTASNPDFWEGGAVTNACDICHGNDADSMDTRSNSQVHDAHLAKGYSCQVCHSDTATNATTLAASGSINGVHVNGTADVAFDSSTVTGVTFSGTSYGTDDFTCGIYCHSNGTNKVAPAWNTDTTGACGTCHQVASGDTVNLLGGAHRAHVFDLSGPQLACNSCHTHDGSAGQANSAHVNGVKDLKADYMATVCDPCHGSVFGGTGNDAQPIWATPGSVSCKTCHTGDVIATINAAAPPKNNYDAAGHGTKLNTPQMCTSCHSTGDDNNHLGALGDTNRLLSPVGVTYNPADSKPFCSLCHSGEDNHFGNDNSTGEATNLSTDGNNCVICHDPHGQQDKKAANLDAMLRMTINGRTVTGFTDKTDRATYYNTVDVGEGVCQTCHDPNEVNNFNRTTANTSHGGSGVCISCHPHTTTPAFKASCDGCHGDSGTGQYWPFGSGGSIPTANDEVGEHDVHVLAISQQLGYGNIADLLADVATDTQQKAICEYCHAGTSNDGDHGLVGSLDADVFVDSDLVRHAKFLNGTADANAVYNNVADTCATVACHNNKTTVDNVYGWHNNANNPGCILCHNDINVTTAGTTGATHAAHTGAATLYGVTINCASCHDAATNWSTKTVPATKHIDGTFDMGGTVSLTYGGSLPTGSTFGSCGINACHENGKGAATPAYTWGTAGGSACGICHAATPTSGDHTVHLSGTQGPNLGTNCSGCHLSNANNTSMASMATHINGTVSFNNVANAPAPYGVVSGQLGLVGNDAVDSCDLCHGGNTAANLAKDYWTTATPVTCGSCHGDYTAAVIGGITAPARAGSAYTSWGHGRSAGVNSSKPNQGCAACHAEASAHISGGLGQNRLDNSPNTNKDYSVVVQRNDYCNDCHTTIGAMNAHFGDGNTPLGGSTDGLYCVTCHDPHGQDSFDAMVKASVGGATPAPGTQPVAGFTDRTDRTKYSNAGFTGVCQTCHASSEVNFFDQDTEDANATHNAGANCIVCHPHGADPAFKASCDSCHGDAAGEYWPQDAGNITATADVLTDFNDNGRHQKHIEVLAAKVYGETTVQLIAVTGNGSGDEKQRVLCSYCHDLSDADHASTGGDADVFRSNAKQYWQAVPTNAGSDVGAVYNAGADTCGTTDCHNNQLTADGSYGWYDADTSNCVMCHVDVPADTKSHVMHIAGSWGFACSNCHAGTPIWADTVTQTAPSTGHMDGTFAVGGGSRTFTYNSGTGSCGVNECHNDGNMGNPLKLDYSWSVGTVVGFCGECHGYPVSTNNHLTHTKAAFPIGSGGTEQFTASAYSCTVCHTNEGLSSSDHLNGAVSFKTGITYSATTAITDGGAFGSCNTSLCHTNGLGANKPTPAWNRAQTATDDCTLCHGDGSGGNIGYSHAAHTGTNGATTYTSGTANQSTSSEYRFDCGLCHGTIIGNHIDGDVDVTVVNWSGSVTKDCSTNDCHHDGQGGAPVQDPDWATGWPIAGGDPCANCHANSPTSNAHHEHEVGFHYDAVYSGLSGFMPVLDADTVPTGLTYVDKDEIRGHGGRLVDDVTSTSTVMTCNVCHWSTVTNYFNDQNSTCATCHDGTKAPLKGSMTIADKTKHVQPNSGTPVQVTFFNQKVRSKAQLRDDLADVTEISNNWTRISGYKAVDGTSYDEQPGTLDSLSTWNSVDKTCTTSCHLWEENRVDKVPAAWGAGSIMCIDCHTRLPK